MSMYNMMHGVCPMAGPILGYLGLGVEDFARFRDAFITGDAGDYKYVVLTRTGGNNREEYQEQIDRVKAHQHFLRDFDDHFDSTYMYFEFKLDEAQEKGVKDLLKTIALENPAAKEVVLRECDMKKATEKAIAAMETMAANYKDKVTS